MSESKRYFKFTVAGQYIALHEAGAKTLKHYSVTFTLPSQEAALSVICKHLLDDKLQKSYPDYIKFRTHAIKSMEIVGRAPNREVLQMGIEEMNREQLSDFCILKGILIDPYKHGDLSHCREVVSTQWRLKRLTQKEKEEHKDAAVNKEVDELRALNDLPPNGDDTKININAQLANVARETLPPLPPNPGVSRDAPTPVEEASADPLPDFVNDEGAANVHGADAIS